MVEGAGAFEEKVAKEVFNEEGFTYRRMVCKMKFLNGSTKSRPNLYHQLLILQETNDQAFYGSICYSCKKFY